MIAQDIPTDFRRNPAASPERIAEAEAIAEFAFPDAYKAFLRQADGGVGFAGNYHVVLWRVEELAYKNQAYEAAIKVPGLYLIGSDGGGEALAFDRRGVRLPIVQVPFLPMELEYAEVLAASFDTFFADLAAWRDDD